MLLVEHDLTRPAKVIGESIGDRIQASVSARVDDLPVKRYETERVTVLFRDRSRAIEIVAYDCFPEKERHDAVVFFIVFYQIDGKTYEPIERMVADVPSECLGSVMEKMGARHGELQHMAPQGDRMRVEFLIPARGLFGYKTEFLTDTRGEGVMSSVFYDYQPYKGEISKRSTGSLIAFETGTAVTYGLFNAQERGTLFIGAGTEVYEGMIIGESPKNEDMAVNVCKKKQLTNTRASGSDDALRLVPPHIMSIEEAMEFISEDEMIEITPKSIRMRKAILSNTERMKKIKGRK